MTPPKGFLTFKVKQHNRCAVLLGFLLLVVVWGSFAQKKVKPIKNPVGWSYTIAPKIPLEPGLSSYDFIVDTQLSPMDWWDEISWHARVGEKDPIKREILFKQAITDTLEAWGQMHLRLSSPYKRQAIYPDFTITLTTKKYNIENVQAQVDFNDLESAICEIEATASLRVVTNEGKIILDESLTYYVDEENQSTQLSIRHFMLNPVFRMKFNLLKRPEKRRKLLLRKLKKYESYVLKYFYAKSGEILKSHFLKQKKTMYAATFGVKNKGHEALNDASNMAKTAINALSALNQNKKRNYQKIKSEIEISLSYWEDKLERTSNPEIQKILYANLSLGHLLMEDLDKAKACLHQIPESKTLQKTTVFHGGFDYYLTGLSEAIATKEKYGELAQIQ
ncbi:hypothetical protein [Flagellimonas sp.]|uniref:hypothetical protein n=1 Tax=Flagellimonas sp. TaxID=2058762 RepID=UPI003F4A49B1